MADAMRDPESPGGHMSDFQLRHVSRSTALPGSNILRSTGGGQLSQDQTSCGAPQTSLYHREQDPATELFRVHGQVGRHDQNLSHRSMWIRIHVSLIAHSNVAA